jgi:hypothetical protein
MFESARKQEVVDGDLRGAIKTYDAIISAHGGNRSVVAGALVAKAHALERLGTGGAEQLYEQVLRQFADQKAAADLARARLKVQVPGAPSEDARGLGAHRASRTVWTGPKVDNFGGGIISRDGRLLPYTDWSTGNLALHDLAGGEDHRGENVRVTAAEQRASDLDLHASRARAHGRTIPVGHSLRWRGLRQ